MNFSDVMREESKWTKTENGADAKNTTDSALLDMFATIGSMRSRSEDEIIQKFELAFQEDSRKWFGRETCVPRSPSVHSRKAQRCYAGKHEAYT